LIWIKPIDTDYGMVDLGGRLQALFLKFAD